MLGSKFIKFLMSILNWQIKSSSNFASFFIVMTHKSPVYFRLVHFLLWIRGSHQSPNFETFECSGENFRNSLCHFSNSKSVFLQILHDSSVSWKITPLHFFRSNFIYFAQKEPTKGYIYQTSECSDQNSPKSSRTNSERTDQLFFKFCITLQCDET